MARSKLSRAAAVAKAQTDKTMGAPEVKDAALFVNREVSWLEFNERVAEEARDPLVPLAERFKFVTLTATNLDEFFMVRVAGLKQQLAGDINERTADGMTPAQTLAAVRARAHTQAQRLGETFLDLLPLLRDKGVRLLGASELDDDQRAYVGRIFKRDLFPALTPLAIDPGHPFPHLRNKSLSLAVTMTGTTSGGYCVVQVPRSIHRLIELPATPGLKNYILLEDVIALHAGVLFAGCEITACIPFRITRNSDLSIDEEEAEDLLETIEQELRRRERGNAVRLEISPGAPDEVRRALLDALGLGPDDVYVVPGPLDLGFALQLGVACPDEDVRDEPFTPRLPPVFRQHPDAFTLIAERDVLLHHPYDSFDSVGEFVSAAASDPAVLAIKMTLYRTSLDSPVPRALMRAAEIGKDVTAVVELKARFDEQANIRWAREMEEAGVHVVYGLIGLKTHCKVCLVVRREPGGIRRYVHLSTGNYNPQTARLYTDVGMFSARANLGEDCSALFNLLTGNIVPNNWHELLVAPMDLRTRFTSLIDREASLSTPEHPGRILAKLNALTDPAIIRALYRASKAGVHIDLICRGVCCLRPGVEGWSENIRVTSIVDRFLEHSRIFYFGNGQPPGKGEMYVSSADWMTRNLDRRVEIVFPVLDETAKQRLWSEVLAVQLKDNVKARVMRADGSYFRAPAAASETERVRSQEIFLRLAREAADGAPPRSWSSTNLPVSVVPRPAA